MMNASSVWGGVSKYKGKFPGVLRFRIDNCAFGSWKIASKLLIWGPPVDDAMIEINNVLPHQINV
jgi:hypothetical protein